MSKPNLESSGRAEELRVEPGQQLPVTHPPPRRGKALSAPAVEKNRPPPVAGAPGGAPHLTTPVFSFRQALRRLDESAITYNTLSEDAG
jgi:hypothetical protein